MKPGDDDRDEEAIKTFKMKIYDKSWQIYKVREDKTLPNNSDIVKKIEESIRDGISREDLLRRGQKIHDEVYKWYLFMWSICCEQEIYVFSDMVGKGVQVLRVYFPPVVFWLFVSTPPGSSIDVCNPLMGIRVSLNTEIVILPSCSFVKILIEFDVSWRWSIISLFECEAGDSLIGVVGPYFRHIDVSSTWAFIEILLYKILIRVGDGRPGRNKVDIFNVALGSTLHILWSILIYQLVELI